MAKTLEARQGERRRRTALLVAVGVLVAGLAGAAAGKVSQSGASETAAGACAAWDVKVWLPTMDRSCTALVSGCAVPDGWEPVGTDGGAVILRRCRP